MYIAVIERPDSSTYEQAYSDFDELLDLKRFLGPDYWIVDIYDGKVCYEKTLYY